MRDRDAALTAEGIEALAWEKMDGLLPAIVQDARAGRVLMLGYMNQAALAQTLATGMVTFWSRSKRRLWTKGETSGHGLRFVSARPDCDGDALLILAEPLGPTCHLGTASCFREAASPGPAWLSELSRIIAERARAGNDASYTRKLMDEGPTRIAQKVGEEGVEVAIAAVAGPVDACVEESADLLYHLAVLMEMRGFDWDDVVATLQARHADRTAKP